MQKWHSRHNLDAIGQARIDRRSGVRTLIRDMRERERQNIVMQSARKPLENMTVRETIQYNLAANELRLAEATKLNIEFGKKTRARIAAAIEPSSANDEMMVMPNAV